MERPSPWIPLPLLVFVLAFISLWEEPLSAQYTFRSRSNQSTIFDAALNPPDREAIRSNAEEAPWVTGALRLAPNLGFRDARFVTNRGSTIQTTTEPTEDRTDFTATFAAGLKGYVKTGEKVIWAVHGIPEYVWWQDDSDRRRLNGRYGAGVFAFFNKLTLEASHRQIEEQGFFSSEIEELASVRVTTTRLYADVEVARGLSVFASGSLSSFSNSEDETPILSRLDRDRNVLRAGVRLAARNGWSLSLGYEDGSTEMDDPVFDRSNDATAGFAELLAKGNRLELVASVAQRSLEPRAGSSFVAADETTGDIQLEWKLDRHFSMSLYGIRELNFSVRDINSHFLTQRQGVAFSYDSRRQRRRVSVELFAESGDDEFTNFLALGQERIDDAETFGGNVAFYLNRNLQLSFGGLRSEIDSNFDLEDREVNTFGFNLIYNFTEALDRMGLRLGSSSSQGW